MTKSKVTIKKIDEIEQKPKKKRFRRFKYKDHLGLIWSAGGSYNENKQLFYHALQAVCTNKFKDIFEAHSIVHKIQV